MSDPEFSRTIRSDTIGATPRDLTLSANDAERAALARRFGLASLGSLTAEVSLHRANQDILATGRLAAELVQPCVVTAEPVPDRVDEDFAIIFRAEPGEMSPDDEVELGEEELDVMFYDGALIDVGEAVAQTLGLSLDPYPRAPGSEEALKEAGVLDESQAGPFGALAELKDKLGQ